MHGVARGRKAMNHRIHQVFRSDGSQVLDGAEQATLLHGHRHRRQSNTSTQKQFVDLAHFLIRTEKRRDTLAYSSGAVNGLLQTVEVLKQRAHRVQDGVHAGGCGAGENGLGLAIAAGKALKGAVRV